jgi:hypothetical protein
MGAAGSHLSKHTVKCPSCEGKQKEPACKRCGGSGKLQGKVKLPLDKQNTGIRSRIAWVKNVREAEDHTGKYMTAYFKKKQGERPFRFNNSRKHHAQGEQIKKYREKLAKDPHHQSDMEANRRARLKEDVPTNCMGTSSSTAGTGHIDIFDPLLRMKLKKARKDKITAIWKRKLLSDNDK